MKVANNEIDTTKYAGKSTTISTTMRMQPWLHSKPMDAAIRRVLASHRRGGRHGQRFRIKHTKHY